MEDKLMSPDVDVIIGSRNGKEHLMRCLEYVYGQIYDGKIRTTVVDNHSTDASVFIVSSRYPQVQLLVNETDLGLAAAYNLALAKTQNRYVLMLHQDVELSPNFVSEQVAVLQNTPQIAGLSARLVLGEEGNPNKTIDSTGTVLRGGTVKLIDSGLSVKDSQSLVKEIFAPAEAAAFWTREALEKIAVNGMIFDEDIVEGYLQLDCAWRAKWAGYRFWYNPRATAVHHRGMLYAKDKERRREVESFRIRSRVLVYKKNLIFGDVKQFGPSLRKIATKEMAEFMSKYGPMRAAELWLSIRYAQRGLKRKSRWVEKNAVVKPSAIYREIFFAKD